MDCTAWEIGWLQKQHQAHTEVCNFTLPSHTCALPRPTRRVRSPQWHRCHRWNPFPSLANVSLGCWGRAGQSGMQACNRHALFFIQCWVGVLSQWYTVVQLQGSVYIPGRRQFAPHILESPFIKPKGPPYSIIQCHLINSRMLAFYSISQNNLTYPAITQCGYFYYLFMIPNKKGKKWKALPSKL